MPGPECLNDTWIIALAVVQSIYFGLTGVWPLVHIRSFLAVTGDKHDRWLVKTLGVLIVAVAVPIGMAAARGAITPEIVVLATSSALALALADIVYVAKGVIPPIYLADATAEIALLLAWGLLMARACA